MNNLGSIILTVTLVVAAVYFLSLGPTVHAFLLTLFHIPEWHHATPIQGIVIRAMFLVAIVVIIRYIIVGVRGD